MARYVTLAMLISVLVSMNTANLQAGEFVNAAKNGDFQRVFKSLASDSSLVNETDDNGYTALHWACIRGQWPIVRELLAAGAPVNAVGADGGTPLHWACHHDREDFVEQMIDAGADIGVANQWGRTPLHVAARRGCGQVAAALVEHGADLNATTREGWTPLHVAYMSGHNDLVRLFLGAGADPERRDEAGERAADQARGRPLEIAIDPSELETYQGIYELGPGITVKVWREGDGLRIQEFAPDDLYATGTDSFFCRQEPWAVRFARGDTGDIAAIEIDFLRRTVRGEKQSRPVYVGSEQCKECHINTRHGSSYVEWLSSRHALAYWRLATDWAVFLAGRREQYRDISAPIGERRCLMCHVTGGQDPNAIFASTFRHEQGIGCETCHGPGSDYIDPDIMVDRNAFLMHGGMVPGEETCRRCHRDERFEFEVFWSKIAHPSKPDPE